MSGGRGARRGPRSARRRSRPRRRRARASPTGSPAGCGPSGRRAWRRRPGPRRPTRTRSGRCAACRPAGRWTARRPAPRSRNRRIRALATVGPCSCPAAMPDRAGRVDRDRVRRACTVDGRPAERLSPRAARPPSRSPRPAPPAPPLPPDPPVSPPSRPPRSGMPAAWFNPPLGTLPWGVSMLMIWGRKAASSGSSWPTLMPELADRRWTVSGPSAVLELGRLDRRVRPGRDPRIDLVAQAARPELARSGRRCRPPAGRRSAARSGPPPDRRPHRR